MAIQRIHTGPRMSQGVRHGDTVHLAGQVADDPVADVQAQTRDVLAKVERLLGELGSDKSRLLAATVYLADMRHYAEMNEVWDAWIDPESPPARACVESRLARPDFLVEVVITAAAD